LFFFDFVRNANSDGIPLMKASSNAHSDGIPPMKEFPHWTRNEKSAETPRNFKRFVSAAMRRIHLRTTSKCVVFS
jgi:hypothetical protein